MVEIFLTQTMPMILTVGVEVMVVVDPVEQSDCLAIISPIMDTFGNGW